MTSLHLPEHLKLKGEENYTNWKELIVNIARGNGLAKYINDRCKRPECIDEFHEDYDEDKDGDKLRKYEAWEKGDAQMQLAI
jgi:hypothetical protein